MTNAQRTQMYASIRQHGEQIAKVFGASGDAVTLAKKLHWIETAMHRVTTDYCNGVIDGEQYELQETKILDRLDKVLGFRKSGIPVFVNGDARGYALKIKTSWINDQYIKSKGTFRLATDMGGYGIIAPDFTPNDQEYNK